MKKNLRRILIAVITVICALSVQISVCAIDIGIGDLNLEDLKDLIGQLTATNPANTTTTTTQAETTTAQGNEDVSNPVSSSGTGSYSTTEAAPTTVGGFENNTYYPQFNINGNSGENNQFTTTEPAGDESTTLSFEASLSDIFEDDSAAVILNPNETFTIGGNLVVKNEGEGKSEFTWQMGALIAAAVLFVILLALIVALVMQNSKKKKKRRYYDSYPRSEDSSGPVPVEIMTPERIAELLGSASGRNVSTAPNPVNIPASYDAMTSDETAAAIKAAALMGQLSGSYSDPILRKYTDEPVMISPLSSPFADPDSVSVADILKATDYIMDDIMDGGIYSATDVSEKDDNQVDTLLNGRICPDCGNDVPVDDVFCHNCGTYIG